MTGQTEAPRIAAAGSPRRGWRRVVRLAGLALALLGWWLSIDLLRLSAGAEATNPWLAAQCRPEATGQPASDCLSVLASSRARVGGPRPAAAGERVGLPWASLGAAYFAFVAIWYAFVGPPTRRGLAWHAVIAAVVLAGLAVSWHLLRTMIFELGRWCAGCAAVHAVNGLLAVVTLLAVPWRRGHPQEVRHPAPALALATLTAGAFATLTHIGLTQWGMVGAQAGRLNAAYARIVQDPDYIRWSYARQVPAEIPIRSDDSIFGDPAAPHTLVAFVDFQCPQCRRLHEVTSKLLAAHPGRLRLVYRHFPQDRGCNPHAQRTLHPVACSAARAVEAARLVGGDDAFRRLTALLYEHQDEIETRPLEAIWPGRARKRGLDPGGGVPPEFERFAGWAVELGLDRLGWVRALGEASVAGRIAEDVDLAHRLGLDAVPVLFLDGRRVQHWNLDVTWSALLSGSDRQASDPGQP